MQLSLTPNEVEIPLMTLECVTANAVHFMHDITNNETALRSSKATGYFGYSINTTITKIKLNMTRQNQIVTKTYWYIT